MVSRPGLVAAGAAVCLAAGCGAGGDAVTAAATQFLDAVERGEGSAACDVVAPAAEESLTSDGTDCAAALTELDIPTGAVESASVWSDRAQVRTSDDVLFLVDLPDGWQVMAAGCTRQPDETYQCLLEGK
jgi:hypothetical protein